MWGIREGDVVLCARGKISGKVVLVCGQRCPGKAGDGDKVAQTETRGS